MPQGFGVLKLAAGLLVVASVLFLVPGLRLLVPGLEKIGTSESRAVPPSNSPVEKGLPSGDQTPSDSSTKSSETLHFGTDELGLGYPGDSGPLGLLGTIQSSQKSSQMSIDDLWGSSFDVLFVRPGDYKQPSAVDLGAELYEH